MCCNAHSKADPANEAPSDHVDDTLVATPLPDEYWLHAFSFDTHSAFPDLIGYGLGFQDKPAAIRLLINPKNSGASGWKLTEIQSFDFPVGMTYADLTGNGFNDIIICDRYGPSMDKASNYHLLLAILNHCSSSGMQKPKTADGCNGSKTQGTGMLSRTGLPTRLEIPPACTGTSNSILRSTDIDGRPKLSNRVVAGHFTETDHFQVMGLPIIPNSSDLTSPAPVIIYTPAYGDDPSKGPQSWSEDIAFPSQFRLIHDAKLLPGTNNGLDMVLGAGREGIVLLWFDKPSKKWEYRIIGSGVPQEGNNPYWGSGSVDVVRVGDDPVGYIAACEAFHGNIVSVYTKPLHSTKGAASLKENIWTRQVVDDFGPLNSAHTGTIHHVHAVDTGTFAIACMGAPVGKPENQGVYVYTAVDNGAFKKTKITEESAGRLAVAAFTEASKEEIAPAKRRINSVQQCNMAARTTISATKLNKEVLLRVPRPEAVPPGVVPSLPLLTIAGKKHTLVVLRPGEEMKLEPSAGAKVIYASIEMTTPDNTVRRDNQRRDVFILVEALQGHFQGPYSAMDQITTTNMFAQVPHVPANVKAMEFPFVKVEDLSWGDKHGQGLWNDFEFYNMTGFHIYFNDDTMEEICHMQAWTLGLGETQSIRRPASTIIPTNPSAKSITACRTVAVNSKAVWQRYFADDYTQSIDTDAELTKSYVESRSTKLIVPTMFEHGPLWKVLPNTKWTPQLRPNDTADYPWHAWLTSEFGERPLPIVPPLPKERQVFDLWLAFEFPTSAFQV
ncbi:hypothetical protein DFH06DRAFT_1400283 [Mycena polygramma]|nr:hypothetical protein DFH06DRAFT_1400283 [Mycena polygramma]